MDMFVNSSIERFILASFIDLIFDLLLVKSASIIVFGVWTRLCDFIDQTSPKNIIAFSKLSKQTFL